MMIVLSGMIGSGKSSLTEILSKKIHTKAFYEPVDKNPVLPLFYSDPKKYAFLLQVYFLTKRFESIKKAMSDDNNILDRSIYEDKLFFDVNYDLGKVTKEEQMTYNDLLNSMMEELPYAAHKKAPDLLIFVDVNYDTAIKRIQKRGRPYEQLSNDSNLESYYKLLISRYGKWYDDYNYSPKMKIDGNKYDFVENLDDRAKVLSDIEHKLNYYKK